MDSKNSVGRGPKGGIISTSDNITDDAWPIMSPLTAVWSGYGIMGNGVGMAFNL